MMSTSNPPLNLFPVFRKLSTLVVGLLLTASVFLTQQANAQAPPKMSYQSVVRNSSNALLTNTLVGMKISVLQGSASGDEVYVETQTATTNANGLLSIQVGSGTATIGTFSGIDWAAGPYFIKTETDPTGGTNYTITGTQELMSVPYAMYAAKSGGTVFKTTEDDADAIHNTNPGNVGIGTDLPSEKLDVAGNLRVRGRLNNMNVGNLGTGTGNVVFGNESYNKTATGDDNTIIGNGAMSNSTSGNNSVAVGAYALNHNINGYWNNAIGYGSLGGNTTGYQNIGLGFGTLSANTTGSKNTAIGNQANVDAEDLTNATAIGNGALVDASNKIQLGNADVTAVNTSGTYTGAGFKTPDGKANEYLMADGSVSTAMQTQIDALKAQVAGLLMPTVIIGRQVWTSTNLNVTAYRDGTPIPEVQDPTEWANLTTGAWCHLNNDPANDAIYGKMYNHYAVVDPRGLAPAGFRIPTFAEYGIMIETIPIGTTCQYTSWNNAPALMSSSFYNGTNTTGFSALNGGSRSGDAIVDFPESPMNKPAGKFETWGTSFWSSDPAGSYNYIYLAEQCSIGSTDPASNLGAYIRLIKN
jgi:uncharacterized protein (TIGR02145 family)